jgi:hypothetical protein
MAEGDPGLEIIKAGAEGVAQGVAAPVVNAARAMIAAVLGDTVDAVDGYFAMRISEAARLRQIKMLARAKAMCVAAGIDPEFVGLKLLTPMLDGVAVEEDADLQERWAALLANAATRNLLVIPGFARILADLVPLEARILDFLVRRERHETGRRIGPGRHWQPPPASYEAVCEEMGFDRSFGTDAFDVHAANMQRLNLVRLTEVDERNVRTSIGLTPLGRAFLQACSVPAGA